MEFKELVAKRRSIRKFKVETVPEEVIGRLLTQTLGAPSSRNTRSTRLLVVDDATLVARMGGMRDYGSAFLENTPLAIVVLGDTTKTDLWRENGSISATVLQLACVDEGLGSCWVHVHGRPCRKEEPDGPSASAFLREFLPIPEGCEPLCVIAIGYPAADPAPLPPCDDSGRVIRLCK